MSKKNKKPLSISTTLRDETQKDKPVYATVKRLGDYIVLQSNQSVSLKTIREATEDYVETGERKPVLREAAMTYFSREQAIETATALLSACLVLNERVKPGDMKVEEVDDTDKVLDVDEVRCAAETRDRDATGHSFKVQCVGRKGHVGPHVDSDGGEWANDQTAKTTT